MSIRFNKLSEDLLQAVSQFDPESTKAIYERYKDGTACTYEQNRVEFMQAEWSIVIFKRDTTWAIHKKYVNESETLANILS